MRNLFLHKTSLITLLSIIGITLPGCSASDVSKIATKGAGFLLPPSKTEDSHSTKAVTDQIQSAARENSREAVKAKEAQRAEDAQRREERRLHPAMHNVFAMLLNHNADLSDPAKQRLSELKTLDDEIREKETALCGINGELKTKIDAEIKAIKDDSSLSDEAKKEKIKAIFESHREEFEAVHKQFETCRQEHPDELKQFGDLHKSLVQGCLDLPPPPKDREKNKDPMNKSPKTNHPEGKMKVNETKLLGEKCTAAKDKVQQSSLLK